MYKPGKQNHDYLKDNVTPNIISYMDALDTANKKTVLNNVNQKIGFVALIIIWLILLFWLLLENALCMDNAG